MKHSTPAGVSQAGSVSATGLRVFRVPSPHSRLVNACFVALPICSAKQRAFEAELPPHAGFASRDQQALRPYI